MEASFKVIVIVEEATPSATPGVVPEIVELAATATPAVNTTVPPTLATGVTRESVLVSATVDFKVQVETPDASVSEQAPVIFPAAVSVAEKVGDWPLIGLLLASLMVIVIVDEATPSATTAVVPEMLEVATVGIPGVKTTVEPAFTTGVAIARTFDSALIDLSVQVEIPEASEGEQRLIAFVVPVSVAVKVGTIPGVGLFEASFKVIVIVEVATPSATTGVVPEIVEFAATGPEAVNATVAAPVTPTGEVSCRVFASVVIEARVQDESPVASLTLQAPYALFVPVSVALKMGVTALIGLL